MRLLGPREQHRPEEARAVFDAFLAANPAVDPDVRLIFMDDFRLPCRGFYRAGRATVILGQLTRPGCGYSWPGHVSDRTLMGVTAHELGHHVHLSRPDAAELASEIRAIKSRPVTGYEGADPDEWFAETFRLFLLNPDLLARGRPIRYAFLTDRLGLRPIETRPWREVLAGAPARMTGRLHKWGLRESAQIELLV